MVNPVDTDGMSWNMAARSAAEVLALTVYDLDWLSGRLTVRQGKGKKDLQ